MGIYKSEKDLTPLLAQCLTIREKRDLVLKYQLRNFKNSLSIKIFDENENFVSVKLVKGGAKNSNILEEHAVDAISGGTITSNGTSNMIDSCLRIYIPFFKKHE